MVGDPAIRVRNSCPDLFAAMGGFWLGYAFGMCRISIRFGGDRRKDIRLSLIVSRDNFHPVDSAVASRVQSIHDEVRSNTASNYKKIAKLIGSLDAELAE